MHYYIDPFGCVKNQVDAENMMSHLDNAGWKNTPSEDADLIIVNSCGFIQSAKQESIDAVLGWRKLYPGKKILLAGCLAQRYAKELSESLPEVDGFFGVDDIAGIVRVAEVLLKRKGSKKNPAVSSGERYLLSMPGSAYVKISEGCDNRCSYCAIPLIRGGLKSRSIEDIVEECRALLARGIKELCIVGQDIGSYGTDGQRASLEMAQSISSATLYPLPSTLPELLTAISKIEARFWVRLLYIHPDHFPLPILDIMEKDRRFLPYFDIPFQHASEKILFAMNRHGNAARYLELIQTIRARLPRAVIRSTFLLGFPGETEKDFTALLDFQQKAQLDWLGCFTYSREENTPAHSMKGQVPKKTAAARKQLIEERQIPITEKNMERYVGKELEVLIEEQVDSFYLGRLYCQAPDIDGAAVITQSSAEMKAGALVPCKVIARRGFDLEIKTVIPS